MPALMITEAVVCYCHLLLESICCVSEVLFAEAAETHMLASQAATLLPIELGDPAQIQSGECRHAPACYSYRSQTYTCIFSVC